MAPVQAGAFFVSAFRELAAEALGDRWARGYKLDPMGTPGKKQLTAAVATTLTFEKFWSWLAGHPNCIVRAGTPEVVLLDHDDFHWTLITEDEHTHVVQLARAKELVGELLVFPAEIAYVQVEPAETDGEWLFECIIDSEKAREVAYHFVMAHEYEDGEHRREEKWTH